MLPTILLTVLKSNAYHDNIKGCMMYEIIAIISKYIDYLQYYVLFSNGLIFRTDSKCLWQLHGVVTSEAAVFCL